jgi:hypothetical protein
MHEVAESSAVALSVFILPAAGFAEVGDWRQFGVKWAAYEAILRYESIE